MEDLSSWLKVLSIDILDTPVREVDSKICNETSKNETSGIKYMQEFFTVPSSIITSVETFILESS